MTSAPETLSLSERIFHPPSFTEIPGGVEFQISLLKSNLMGGRLKFLDSAVQGLSETGTSLVGIGMEKPGILSAVPLGDDIGMFVVIPHLAKWLDISPAITMMMFLIIGAFVGAVFGIAMSFMIFKSWPSRLFSVFSISFLTIAAISIAGDFYLLMVPATLVVGFFALYVFRNIDITPDWVLFSGLFLCGFYGSPIWKHI